VEVMNCTCGTVICWVTTLISGFLPAVMVIVLTTCTVVQGML
jgi:hypothetical protein